MRYINPRFTYLLTYVWLAVDYTYFQSQHFIYCPVCFNLLP